MILGRKINEKILIEIKENLLIEFTNGQGCLPMESLE